MDPLRSFHAFHEQNTFRHLVVATHGRQPEDGRATVCPSATAATNQRWLVAAAHLCSDARLQAKLSMACGQPVCSNPSINKIVYPNELADFRQLASLLTGQVASLA
jgi:hypothetical protein